MHKLCKVSPLLREEITTKYNQLRLEYKQKHWTTWGSKTLIFRNLSTYYRIHTNTVAKIVDRWKHKDFSIHKSTRKDYRTFARGIEKINTLQKKIIKRRERLAGIVRYEKRYAWELWHIDVHKVKNVQWQNPKKKKYLAALEDDATRVTYSQLLPNKKARTLALFLHQAYLWFRRKWIIFKAILSDNGKEFTTHSTHARQNHIFERTLNNLNIKHKYTKICRPQTNGKIERWWRIFEEQFFQKNIFSSWKHFNHCFKDWLHFYNHIRPHGWLRHLTPWQKFEITLISKNGSI